MNAGTVVRIALPGVADGLAHCAARGETVRLPAAEWLVARGECRRNPGGDWRLWLLEGAGLGADVLERLPAGPCVLAARTASEPQGTWACAEPVHLLTALDHLQLGAPVPVPIGVADRGELVAALNDHFADRGFRLHAPEQGGWLCRCPEGLRCTSVEPAAAIGANLRDLLPVGPDAARVRAFVNESQMLLHDHPVNIRRSAHGEPAVNSIWLWGIGAAARPAARATGVLVSDDDWLAGLWQMHGGVARPLAELADALRQPAGEVRVAIAPDTAGSGAASELARVEREVLVPLRAALSSGQVGAATLLLGGRVVELGAGARRKFWRRARPLGEVLR
jgi:hypothetical protein